MTQDTSHIAMLWEIFNADLSEDENWWEYSDAINLGWLTAKGITALGLAGPYAE